VQHQFPGVLVAWRSW